MNETNRELVSQRLLPWLSDEARQDAHLIYTDEGGHSEFCFEFATRLRSQAEIDDEQPLAADGSFAERLVGREEQAGLIRLFWSLTTEMLVTPHLLSLANDRSVQPSVRKICRDHADDEARHHVFFSQVLRNLWPNLSMEGRKALAEEAPRALLAFLEPDQRWLISLLEGFPLITQDPASVVREAVTAPQVGARLRRSARSTLRAFSRAIGYQDFYLGQAFKAAGLI